MNLIKFFETLFRQPTTWDLYRFFQEIAPYIESGQSWQVALKNIRTENPVMKRAISNMRQGLEKGKTVTEAMRDEKVFPKIYQAAIKAGEKSDMEYTLKNISTDLKHERGISRKITNAILPTKIITVFLILAFSLLGQLIVPRFEKIYADQRLPLPMITKVVFGTVNFIGDYWLVIVGMLLGIYAGFKWFCRINPVIVDSLKLKIPLYKNVYYYLLQYRFTSSFGMLTKAGLDPSECLTLVSQVVGNEAFGQIPKQAAQKILSKGLNISDAIAEVDKRKIIHPVAVGFIKSGEDTGLIYEQAEKASDYFKEVLEDELEKFSNLISVLFLLPSAGGIILLYIATFAPQLALFQSLGMK